MVVVVGDVLFVDQVAVNILFEFRFGLEPEFNGEPALGSEVGVVLGSGSVRFVSNWESAERFESATEAPLWREVSAPELEVMDVLGVIDVFVARLELPKGDDVRVGGIGGLIDGVPRIAQLEGICLNDAQSGAEQRERDE